jgi:hypothetical protein
MQNNLCLVQLLLYFENAAYILRILIVIDVCCQCGVRDGFSRRGCTRVLGYEIVKKLGEDLMCGKRRIFVVANDNTSYASGVGVRVGVECEVYMD